MGNYNCNNICNTGCRTVLSNCRARSSLDLESYSKYPALPMQHDDHCNSIKNNSSQTPLFQQEIYLENLNFSSFFYRKEELEILERFPEITNSQVLKTLRKINFFDFSQINCFFEEFENFTINGKNYFSNEKTQCFNYNEFKLLQNLFYKEIENLSVSGPFIMEDRSVYEGQWKCGKRHGYGKLLFPAFSLGKLIHSSGDCYFGNWKDNKANGMGIYFHEDGAIYHGEWYDDKKWGFGVEKWTENSQYFGMFSNGEKNGKGFFKWSDGSSYEGEFYENKMHGKGTYCWSDGRRFRGNWKEDKIEGYGKIEYPDGRYYLGNFVDSKREGYGVFHWIYNLEYRGHWKKGLQHGKGKLVFPEKTVLKGYWKNGQIFGITRKSLVKLEILKNEK